MRGLKFGATVAALLAVSLPAQIAPAWAETTVLKNVTVIDGTGAAAKPNSAIVMTDGKIAYVGPVSGLKAPAGAKVAGSVRQVRDARHHRQPCPSRHDA